MVNDTLSDETTTSILYTYKILGNLDYLPRLYTFIRRLRGELTEGQVFLVDLGKSCVPDIWPCSITEGRSTLLVLDAMGFHAANCDGVLTPVSRAKLVGQVGLALVNSAYPHVQERIQFVTYLDNDTPLTGLTVCLVPSEETYLEGGVLRLQQVESKQVGLVRFRQGQLYYAVHDLPPDTPPDPIISGAVDFVRDEARYFEKRRQDK